MRTLSLPLALLLAGCALPGGASDDARPVEATSLLGEALVRPALARDFSAEQSRLLARAEAELADDPDSVEAWIWVGRRLGYLGRYREAIEHYGRAIERFPGDARLYRHRGHRFITVRAFDRAIADLEIAAALIAGMPDRIEPDGLPNEAGIPTSTLHTNIHYHLGLARFLSGDFDGARAAYTAGYEAASNPDMRSAMAYWLLLALWRRGTETEARLLRATVDPDWTLIENEDYHAMVRAFAGDTDPRTLLLDARETGGVRFATVGYGVGAWLRWTGDRDAALTLWREVVDAGSWSAFGAIAAEAELRRAE